jgi:hypothetical protein
MATTLGPRPKCRLCNAWITDGLCQNPECHNFRKGWK